MKSNNTREVNIPDLPKQVSMTQGYEVKITIVCLFLVGAFESIAKKGGDHVMSESVETTRARTRKQETKWI